MLWHIVVVLASLQWAWRHSRIRFVVNQKAAVVHIQHIWFRTTFASFLSFPSYSFDILPYSCLYGLSLLSTSPLGWYGMASSTLYLFYLSFLIINKRVLCCSCRLDLLNHKRIVLCLSTIWPMIWPIGSSWQGINRWRWFYPRSFYLCDRQVCTGIASSPCLSAP